MRDVRARDGKPAAIGHDEVPASKPATACSRCRALGNVMSTRDSTQHEATSLTALGRNPIRAQTQSPPADHGRRPTAAWQPGTGTVLCNDIQTIKRGSQEQGFYPVLAIRHFAQSRTTAETHTGCNATHFGESASVENSRNRNSSVFRDASTCSGLKPVSAKARRVPSTRAST